MSKNVLLLAPKVANLYLEIIAELERQGYLVDYYEYRSFKLDPYYIKGYVKYGRMFTSKTISSIRMKREWESVLASAQYNKSYDYLFVVDGYSLHPCLFNTLKQRNPGIKCVNYLFDSTYSNYEFNVHFPFFDKVATFDIKDSKKFNINLLPIYWIDDQDADCEQDLKFFGMGSDIGCRYALFSKLEEYSKTHGYDSFIKIYLDRQDNMRKYKFKYRIVEALSSKSVMTPPEHFSAPIVTHESMSTSYYRKMIRRSEIIIDSNAPHQDGLTARFMWALGAEKKIVTTNAAVKEYDFYTPEQIYVVDDIETFTDSPDFESFVNSDYRMSDEIRTLVQRYRIDNWISWLLC